VSNLKDLRREMQAAYKMAAFKEREAKRVKKTQWLYWQEAKALEVLVLAAERDEFLANGGELGELKPVVSAPKVYYLPLVLNGKVYIEQCLFRFYNSYDHVWFLQSRHSTGLLTDARVANYGLIVTPRRSSEWEDHLVAADEPLIAYLQKQSPVRNLYRRKNV
jgi:hypothetical protein